MHEYSIVQALIERVAEAAAERGATAIRRVHVRIGELSGVEPELLATAYDTFRERTICENAPLELTSSPASWKCPRCTRELVRGQILRCPECALPASLSSGDEILLERIEMEVSDV
jgi:hydrogenase nickel incorporation protein HypA/HybF